MKGSVGVIAAYRKKKPKFSTMSSNVLIAKGDTIFLERVFFRISISNPKKLYIFYGSEQQNQDLESLLKLLMFLGNP